MFIIIENDEKAVDDKEAKVDKHLFPQQNLQNLLLLRPQTCTPLQTLLQLPSSHHQKENQIHIPQNQTRFLNSKQTTSELQNPLSSNLKSIRAQITK